MLLVLNEARKAQGFTSQEQLDGFFRYYDHTKACTECQKPGPAMPLDDGMQPTENRCEKAQALFAEYCRL